MNPFIGRILSGLATAGVWLLLGGRSVLDIIGYSTLPDDTKVAADRLDAFFMWLLGLPWWATLGFALASTMWLMWVSWPRSTQRVAAELAFSGQTERAGETDAGEAPPGLVFPASSSFEEKGLYVGSIAVSTGKLAEERVIEITARCFNGTGSPIFVHRAEGAITAKEGRGGSAHDVGELPVPWLKDEPNTDNIAAFSEFPVVLEQRVPGEIARRILDMDSTYSISFDLGALRIRVGSTLSRDHLVDLPLWDGVSISRNRDYIQSNRMVILRVAPINFRLG
jgi:hypothetical protein